MEINIKFDLEDIKCKRIQELEEQLKNLNQKTESVITAESNIKPAIKIFDSEDDEKQKLKKELSETKNELILKRGMIKAMEVQYQEKEKAFKNQIANLNSKLEELSKRKDYNDGYEKGYNEGYNKAKEEIKYIDNINELTEDLMKEIETLKKKCKVYEDRIVNDQVTIRAYRDKDVQLSEEDFLKAKGKLKNEKS